MLNQLRITADLGHPPEPFYESQNSVIKQQMNYSTCSSKYVCLHKISQFFHMISCKWSFLQVFLQVLASLHFTT